MLCSRNQVVKNLFWKIPWVLNTGKDNGSCENASPLKNLKSFKTQTNIKLFKWEQKDCLEKVIHGMTFLKTALWKRSKMGAQEELELLSSYWQIRSTTTYGIIPTELKTSLTTFSTTRDRRATLRWMGGAGTVLPKTLFWAWQTTIGSFYRRRRVYAPNWSSQLLGPVPERGRPKNVKL